MPRIPEDILKKYRPEVTTVTVYGIPITDLSLDELQCMFVMAAKAEKKARERAALPVDLLAMCQLPTS